MPAFWTSAIDLGIFPQWMPFQSMGYPFLLNAQTALFYPFLWLFPLFSIQYTLQAAVIFQIIHILFGSIGMFFLLMHMFKSPKYAIIGAVAFQFFGGFYANSEHVDIVRGFVILPWLFYVLTLDMEKPSITKKTLFIPIVLFLVATGAYPGILISTIFIISIFIILQTFNIFLKGFGKRKSISIGVTLFGFLVVGIVLSTVNLGPFMQYGEEQLPRFADRSNLRYHFFTIEQFPGFFMSNTPIPGQVAMTSMFITLPIVIFASFISLHYIKKYWIFFVIFLIGILMAFGNQTPFWSSVNSIIPILDFSRFPVSDYRIFVIIPLLIFSISGLKSIIEKRITLNSFISRIAFTFSWFALGILLLHNYIFEANRIDFDDMIYQINFSIVILIITISILVIFFLKNNKLLKQRDYQISIILVTILISIIVVDGFRVISDMYTWDHKGSFDKRYVKADVPLEKDGKLIVYSIIENTPEVRPERITKKELNELSWAGSLTGNYMMKDQNRHFILSSRSNVEANDIYKDYMFMKWTPILLDVPSYIENNIIFLEDEIFTQLDNYQNTSVVQTHYGINDIIYKVSLNEPKLMIENEIYFPGWSATLINTEKEIEISSININDAFRGWILPAGDYQMKASFQFPDLIKYQIISLSAFIIWVVMLVVFLFSSRTNLTKIKENQ